MPERNRVQVDIVVKTEGGKIVAELSDTMGDVGEQFEKVAEKGSKFQSAMDSITRGVFERAGQMATEFVMQIPKMTAELFKLGTQSEATALRFERFAGGADRAEMFLQAFQNATDGTVSRMASMQGASKLLQMGLVETSDEMGTVAAITTKLGDQTMSAGDRIGDFAALLANQSIPRLDNFGISSGRVRARIEELQASIEGLSREEAFKIAVIEEGNKALQILGDTTDTAAVKMDKLKAATEDAKEGLGPLLLGVVENTGGVDDLAARIRNIPTALQQVVIMAGATYDGLAALNKLKNPFEAFNNSMKRGAASMVDWNHESELSRYRQYHLNEAVEDGAKEIQRISYMAEDASVSHGDYARSAEDIEKAIERATPAVEDFRKAQEDAKAEIERVNAMMQRQAEAAFGLAQEWHGFEEDRTKTAEDFAEEREEIEAAYLEQVATLQERGKTTYYRIDEDAKRRQLAITEARIQEALEQQAEFNEETSTLDRLRMEERIANLQGEAQEQRSILERSYDGMVAVAGENTDKLIAEAQRDRDESIAALEEKAAAQEKIQRENFGRMLLDTATRFAEMRGIPAEETLRMQTEISKQYGLIDEKTADSANQWITALDKWADGATVDLGKVAERLGGFGDTMDTETEDWESQLEEFSTNARGEFQDYEASIGSAVGKTATLRDAINELQSKEITITTRIQEIKEVVSDYSPGATIPDISAQHGFAGIVGPGFGGPIRITAGEGNQPERVTVQPVNNYTMNVSTRATSPAVQQDFRIMEALGRRA